MKYTIDEIKKITTPIAKEYDVSRMFLFGSYAKNTANEDSDIDFYIEKGGVNSLIVYYSFVNQLEKKFNRHVDVVTTEIRDRDFLDAIKKDGILIYE